MINFKVLQSPKKSCLDLDLNDRIMKDFVDETKSRKITSFARRPSICSSVFSSVNKEQIARDTFNLNGPYEQEFQIQSTQINNCSKKFSRTISIVNPDLVKQLRQGESPNKFSKFATPKKEIDLQSQSLTSNAEKSGFKKSKTLMRRSSLNSQPIKVQNLKSASTFKNALSNMSKEMNNDNKLSVNSLTKVEDPNLIDCEFYNENSLFTFKKSNFVRAKLFQVAKHPYFSYFFIFILLFDSLNFWFYINFSKSSVIYAFPAVLRISQVLNYFFCFCYISEILAKVVAFGFYGAKLSFLSSSLNELDLILTLLTCLPFIFPSLYILNTIRYVKLIKLLIGIPSLQNLLIMLLYSIKEMKGISILLLFFLMIASLISLYLFKNKLDYFCMTTPQPANGEYLMFVQSDIEQKMIELRQNYELNPQTLSRIYSKSLSCGGSYICPNNSFCRSEIAAYQSKVFFMNPSKPLRITISFNNILNSALNLYRAITSHEILPIINDLSQAYNIYITEIFFYLIIILLFRYFILKVIVGIMLNACQLYYKSSQDYMVTMSRLQEMQYIIKNVEENNQFDLVAYFYPKNLEEENVMQSDLASSHYSKDSNKKQSFAVNFNISAVYNTIINLIRGIKWTEHIEPSYNFHEKWNIRFICYFASKQPLAKNLITLISIINLVLLIYQLDNFESAAYKKILCFVNGIISLHILLKIAGVGLINYFKSFASAYDAIVLCAAWIEYFINGTFTISTLHSFKTVSIFFVLKEFQSLGVVFRSLFSLGLEMVKFIPLLIVFLYFFTLTAQNLFKDKLKFTIYSGYSNYRVETRDFEFYNLNKGFSYIESFETNKLFNKKGNSPIMNFDSFYYAFYSILYMLVGDNWNTIYDDCMLSNDIPEWHIYVFFTVASLTFNVFLRNLILAFLLFNFEVSRKQFVYRDCSAIYYQILKENKIKRTKSISYNLVIPIRSKFDSLIEDTEINLENVPNDQNEDQNFLSTLRPARHLSMSRLTNKICFASNKTEKKEFIQIKDGSCSGSSYSTKKKELSKEEKDRQEAYEKILDFNRQVLIIQTMFVDKSSVINKLRKLKSNGLICNNPKLEALAKVYKITSQKELQSQYVKPDLISGKSSFSRTSSQKCQNKGLDDSIELFNKYKNQLSKQSNLCFSNSLTNSPNQSSLMKKGLCKPNAIPINSGIKFSILDYKNSACNATNNDVRDENISDNSVVRLKSQNSDILRLNVNIQKPSTIQKNDATAICMLEKKPTNFSTHMEKKSSILKQRCTRGESPSFKLKPSIAFKLSNPHEKISNNALKSILEVEKVPKISKFHSYWQDWPNGYSLFLFSPRLKLRIWVLELVENRFVEYLALLLAIFNVVVMALEYPSIYPKGIVKVYHKIDYLFSVFFFVEMILRIFACGFFYDSQNTLPCSSKKPQLKSSKTIAKLSPTQSKANVRRISSMNLAVIPASESNNRKNSGTSQMLKEPIKSKHHFEKIPAHFRNTFNIVDGIVSTYAFLLFLFIVANLNKEMLEEIQYFKVLVALRPLTMINKSGNLRSIVETIFNSIKLILSLFIVLVYICFILGVIIHNLLGQSLGTCSDTEYSNRYKCLLANGTWNPSNYSYEHIYTSVLVLIEMGSGENWFQIMQTSLTPYHNQYLDWTNLKYFCFSFLFVCIVVLLNIFILNLIYAVIVYSYSNTKQEQLEKIHIKTNCQKQFYMLLTRFLSYRPIIRPLTRKHTSKLRKKMINLLEHKYFKLIKSVIIVIFYLTLLLTHSNQSDIISSIQYYTFIIFVIVLNLKEFFKIYAYIDVYFKSSKYFGELIENVVLAIVLIYESCSTKSITGFSQNEFKSTSLICVLKLVKIRHLISISKPLSEYTGILKALIPNIINISLLIILLFVIYAVAGMGLFGTLRYGKFITANNNFESFGNSIFVLLKLLFGSSWNSLMREAGSELIGCRKPDLEWEELTEIGPNSCGSFVSYVYFLGFFLMFYILMMNLFVAIIIDFFLTSLKTAQIIKEKDIAMLFKIWNKYDPELTQFITIEQMMFLFVELTPPSGINEFEYKIACNSKELKGTLHFSPDNQIIFDSTTLIKLARIFNFKIHTNKVHITEVIIIIINRILKIKGLAVDQELANPKFQHQVRILVSKYDKNYISIPELESYNETKLGRKGALGNLSQDLFTITQVLAFKSIEDLLKLWIKKKRIKKINKLS